MVTQATLGTVRQLPKIQTFQIFHVIFSTSSIIQLQNCTHKNYMDTSNEKLKKDLFRHRMKQIVTSCTCTVQIDFSMAHFVSFKISILKPPIFVRVRTTLNLYLHSCESGSVLGGYPTAIILHIIQKNNYFCDTCGSQVTVVCSLE